MISAWHQHRIQTDHIFVVSGMLRVVLYHPREDSPTKGAVNVLNVSNVRPTLLVVPPEIWHGVRNLSSGMRLPRDTPEIPYSFDA